MIEKKIGETPLQAIERFRISEPCFKDEPMTYAGRLDPMAEGELLVLVGDECKNKERYLSLDKEYEVEVVCGISTDTYDGLGLAALNSRAVDPSAFKKADLVKYIGKFDQDYPAYSSRTVNGKQLHELARAGELPEEMPTKEVEIYSIELLDQGKILAGDLKSRIFGVIDKVTGDFRQEEIKKRWDLALKDPAFEFETIKILVRCSSGTYMRSLADRIGKDIRTGAFALSIKRTKILGL